MNIENIKKNERKKTLGMDYIQQDFENKKYKIAFNQKTKKINFISFLLICQ